MKNWKYIFPEKMRVENSNNDYVNMISGECDNLIRTVSKLKDRTKSKLLAMNKNENIYSDKEADRITAEIYRELDKAEKIVGNLLGVFK